MTDTTHEPTDDLVKRICQDWVKDGRSDECFWEGWPECPTPEDSLTPRMVIDRIVELEAKLAQQDDLVQAAVAAALREAINRVSGCDRISEVQPAILSLIPEGAE